ncbi:MAG: DUF1232 domain-containing protein [Eubacteriaceae bacterium]|nr:DUF1232 domain-containing protein [Eubacteriaceae bacterium]
MINRFATNFPILLVALKKKQTPVLAKILTIFSIGYALSPIDLVSDFIPLLGILDDVLILTALFSISMSLIPKEMFDEYRNEAQIQKNMHKTIAVVALLVILAFIAWGIIALFWN